MGVLKNKTNVVVYIIMVKKKGGEISPTCGTPKDINISLGRKSLMFTIYDLLHM